MNKINFTAKDSFPLSSDTMEMMQQMIGLSANMALLGGANYILSGCVDDGTGNISTGLVVINGEILPLVGGIKKAKITIRQTSKTLAVFGVEYPEVYLYRVAEFSDAGEYGWSEFVQVLTNQQLENKINALKEESAGFIKMWSGKIDRIPDDYLLCDGSIKSTSQYPKLAYSLGKEAEESFSLPDLRGRFIVGYQSNDGDYNEIGKTAGERQHTLVIAEMPRHVHAYTDDINAEGKYGAIEPGFPQRTQMGNYSLPTSGEDSGAGTVYDTQEVGGSQPHENRPPYYVLAYVIKVK